jgi:hypothetical protein
MMQTTLMAALLEETRAVRVACRLFQQRGCLRLSQPVSILIAQLQSTNYPLILQGLTKISHFGGGHASSAMDNLLRSSSPAISCSGAASWTLSHAATFERRHCVRDSRGQDH